MTAAPAAAQSPYSPPFGTAKESLNLTLPDQGSRCILVWRAARRGVIVVLVPVAVIAAGRVNRSSPRATGRSSGALRQSTPTRHRRRGAAVVRISALRSGAADAAGRARSV